MLNANMEIEKQKSSLRKIILALRRARSFRDIEKKSGDIRRKLFTFVPFCQAETILFYLAMKDEVQTEKMIEESLQKGKRVAAPLIDWQRKEILPSEIKDLTKDIEISVLKIPQPKNNLYSPFSPVNIDIVIVPGVVFDRKGNRLGFGGGFYDRFLGKLSDRTKLVALAFELQLVDNVSSQSYDIAVDYLITERGIINCKNHE